MSEPKGKKISLYSLLLKKLRGKLILWYFFTLLSSFFYYQAIFALRTWNYQEPPYSLFLGAVVIRTQISLLWCSFFCFFIGFILSGLICEFLKHYCRELCRFNLRKLLLVYSMKNPSQSQLYNEEIKSNFFGEVELFAPLFILSPQKIFAASVNIILNFIFLTNFRNDNFAIFFVMIVSLILIFFSFFTYQIQKKTNQKQNEFRQRENLAMKRILEKSLETKKIEKLINSNFRKTQSLLKKKTLSYLPALIISGLNIFFCLTYYYFYYDKNWGMKNVTTIFTIATSIQVIFWKIKDITDTLPEISKIKIYYKPLEKIIKKIGLNKSE